MKISTIVHKLLVKFRLRNTIDYSSVEHLRSVGVRIGENVNLINTTIDGCHGFLVSIGNNVTLTGVTVLAHDASTQIPFGVTKVGRVIIGDDVFVGTGTVILPNVNIGNRVVVGAGSVVTHDIPDNSIAAGNPAKVIGTYDDFLEKHKSQMNTRPVYNTLWCNKTEKEKELMRHELAEGVGYDL